MKTRPTLTPFAATLIAACLVLPTAAHASLVGLWQFEGDFTDTSTEGNDGAGINGVSFVAGQAGYGQAADFDGADSHVLVGHDASLNITSVGTFAAWVNADGNAWEGILAKSPSNGSAAAHAGNYELRLENGSQNITFLYQRGGANDTAQVNSGTNVPSSVWHHVAVTVDGSGATETVRFYLDGVLTGTVAGQPNGFGATNTNPLYLGSRADLFTDFHGQLDDVAVFNHILDASDIRLLQAGLVSSTGVSERIDGVVATATSELTDGGFDRGTSRTTDESGLNAIAGSHANAPTSNMWLSDGVGFGGSATDDPDPEITFDLGTIHRELDAIQVWNYNEHSGNPALFTQRGVQDTRILISDDDVTYTALTDPTDLDQVFRFDQATGDGSVDFSQLIELNLAGVEFRYIKFDIITAWTGDNFDTNAFVSEGFVGLSEVRFFGEVPTPAALPAGLAMLGLAAARRRRR